MRSAVFLDRDGVIIENRPNYVRSWDEVQFLTGALEALKRLAESPLATVVVTNQAAVGRGILEFASVCEIQQKIMAQIHLHGGRIDGSYICPHHPDDGCVCRKPAPGMLQQAAEELSLDLESSWIVGDALTDLEAGWAAGVRGILVLTGRGKDQAAAMSPEAAAMWPVVPDLSAAVERILKSPTEC